MLPTAGTSLERTGASGRNDSGDSIAQKHRDNPARDPDGRGLVFRVTAIY